MNRRIHLIHSVGDQPIPTVIHLQLFDLDYTVCIRLKGFIITEDRGGNTEFQSCNQSVVAPLFNTQVALFQRIGEHNLSRLLTADGYRF